MADGGVLTGTVRFTGTPPRLEPITVSKNRDVCGEHKPSEALVLGPDRGVRGSVILLEGVARGKPRRRTCCSTTASACSSPTSPRPWRASGCA